MMCHLLTLAAATLFLLRASSAQNDPLTLELASVVGLRHFVCTYDQSPIDLDKIIIAYAWACTSCTQSTFTINKHTMISV